ncbi:polymer-forming cytoskeletal protein [Thermocrinis sp.]|jgi:cytoskeletal protein CcmA (bactofilin family)|uniref:bactofilin family protein n=1 Tax=Thermocrinis sp. TaxID=2024383 RepID=UPI0026250328|nr:polymer-forming cytoskeletal protein [Thermocrinis sp.]
MLGRKKETELSSQEVRTILGPGCLFEGNLTLPEGLTRIDGEVIGNIKGDGSLIIGERGSVKGDLSIENVVVYGKVHGNIKARSLEIRASGRVDGDVQVQELIVERGAIYNGKCSMGVEGSEVG